METFDQLKNDLKSDSQGRLWLDQVLVVIMPRWFFVDIMTEVEELAGAETAAKVYYQAGYKGAVKWCTLQMEAGLNGREVMAQYLNSATLRGWGRFEIVEFNEEVGRGLFRLFNSAVAEEKGAVADPVCIHLAGSLAGGFQSILDYQGKDLKVRGREISCGAQGRDYCEFVVEPE